jgi:hypothetical protein
LKQEAGECFRINDLEMNDELINRLTMEEKAFGEYSEGDMHGCLKMLLNVVHQYPQEEH